MKKLYLLIAIFFISTMFVFSQTTDYQFCGTMEYLDKQKKENPNLEAQMAQFEEQVQIWIKEHKKSKSAKNQLQAEGTVTIPIVVHILYYTDDQNITDEKVNEQISITNRDYAGLSTVSMGAFPESLRANTGFQFELAKKTPDGKSTNGIERRQTTRPSFSSSNNIKFTAGGGLDAWDPKLYLNIWVCQLEGFGGFAQFPGTGVNETYGLVMKFSMFGTGGPIPGRNSGGGNTHEIGHCFNLYHTWGDDQGACTGTDYCVDTPNESFPALGYFGGLVTDDCSPTNPGIMYMNIMDYTDDANFANFTPDQTTRMQACFASPGGPLLTLLSSTACSEPTNYESPTAIQAQFITKATATLNWTAMVNALSYNIRYRKVGSSTWTTVTSTTNTKQITGLVRNTSYEFQVQNVTALGSSSYSYNLVFKTPSQEPSSAIGIPTLFSPSNNAVGVDLNPTMTWSHVSNETYYILQYSEYSDFSDSFQIKVTFLNPTIGGLQYGKSYYWRVKASNLGFSGAWSTVNVFHTLQPTLPPTLLIAPLDNATGVPVNMTLTWTPVENTSYVLQYSTDKFVNYTEITTNVPTADLAGLSTGTLYFWRVRTINGTSYGPWSQRMFTTTPPALGIPSLISPADGATNTTVNPVLSCDSVAGATYYVYQYSEDGTFATITGAVITTATSANLAGLKNNTTYFWRVKAFVSEAYRGYSSEWSLTRSFTTEELKLAAPTLLSPSNNSSNIYTSPTLSWNSVNGALIYNLEYSLNADMSGATQATTSSASYAISGLTEETTYYWRVKAQNGDLFSEWSAIWNFKTKAAGLDAPVLTSPSNNSTNISTSPTLSWNAVSGATSYDLEYSKSSTFSPSTAYNDITVTSKSISGLSKRTTYYWRVLANDANGSSVWSSVWNFKTANSGKFGNGEDEIGTQSATLEFSPNPLSNTAHFTLEVSTPEVININIVDIFGKSVANLMNEQKTVGTYTFDFDASDLLPGVYYCHLMVGNEITTMKLVIVR